MTALTYDDLPDPITFAESAPEFIRLMQGTPPAEERNDVLPGRWLRFYRDLEYVVLATSYSHSVEYVVYGVDFYTLGKLDVEGQQIDYDRPMLHRKDSSTTPDGVETFAEADYFLRGTVKWDGCSDWNLSDNAQGYLLHSCGRETLLNVGKIMAACWDWTAHMCPSWNP